MTVGHFSDAKPGWFYFDPEAPGHFQGWADPAPIQFASRYGIGLPLWSAEAHSAAELLGSAGLGWPVLQLPLEVPPASSHGVILSRPLDVQHYRALVRPDTRQVMSVVTTSYSVAENEWVAGVVESISCAATGSPGVIAATAHGREGERSLIVGRMGEWRGRMLCLVATNSHGGQGAVRFHFIEFDRDGTAVPLPVAGQSWSHTHTGRLHDTLGRSARHGDHAERYLDAADQAWRGLEERLWSPRHTQGLIDHLWGDRHGVKEGVLAKSAGTPPEFHSDPRDRHPRAYLSDFLSGVSAASTAYERFCEWLDLHSEACERGDFTKDRIERLALGAGTKVKTAAWRWVIATAA